MTIASGTRQVGGPPWLLRATAVTLLVLPADQVFAPLGATGYVGMMLALLLAVAWLGSSLFGLHDPIARRHPARVAIALLFLVSCVSYALYVSGMTIPILPIGQASADRWLLLLVAGAGITLVASDSVRTLDDAMVLVRALTFGAFLCSIVAVVQFTTGLNPVDLIRGAMWGFENNGGSTPFQVRDGLTRVAGTTYHPIELAVVTAIILPLSVWRALYDRKRRAWFRWSIPIVLLVANAATVSRSGLIALLLAAVLSVGFLPTVARRWALLAIPAAVAGLFLTTPGLIGTLTGSVTAGTSDSSITNRLDNYPRVAALVLEHPFFGTGPATYLPVNAKYILDNQYLNAAICLGVIGAACVIAYLCVPAVFALIAAQYAREPRLRSLAGAVASGCAVSAVCSATFDSMAFPVFALLYPFVLGLAGSVWILVKEELAGHRQSRLRVKARTRHPHRHHSPRPHASRTRASRPSASQPRLDVAGDPSSRPPTER
ncbi:O-antigen ligase family protein [Microbacteriaceae bacterium VKM Ac-2855]|nr:O-antigen ligase family protein [Microbacteriaceae bacterium VKM Ac-2855]